MRPLFDCLSCDKFAPEKLTPGRGGCHARPPVPILLGLQQVGNSQQPVFQSMWPGVGKGDWCWDHPMAKQVQVFTPRQVGETSPLNGDGLATDVAVEPVRPEQSEPLLPGELKPANER